MHIFQKKLNQRGFGHLEVALVVVVVAVVVLAGAVVFAKSSSKNTAHAGGWTQLGSGTMKATITPTKGAATSASQTASTKICHTVNNSSQWTVQTQTVITASTSTAATGNWAMYLFDDGYTGGRVAWSKSTPISYLKHDDKGTVNISMAVNPKYSNELQLNFTHVTTVLSSTKFSGAYRFGPINVASTAICSSQITSE